MNTYQIVKMAYRRGRDSVGVPDNAATAIFGHQVAIHAIALALNMTYGQVNRQFHEIGKKELTK